MDLEDTSVLQVDVDWDELDTGRVRQYLKLEIPDNTFGWGGKHIWDMLSLARSLLNFEALAPSHNTPLTAQCNDCYSYSSLMLILQT